MGVVKRFASEEYVTETITENIQESMKNLPTLITVTSTDTDYTANKTYDEILELLNNEILPYCYFNDTYYHLMISNETYIVFDVKDSTNKVLDYSWILFYPDGTINVTNSQHDLEAITTEAHEYTDSQVDILNETLE